MTPHRKVWKAHHRRLRIQRREARKIEWDLLVYGNGFYKIVDGIKMRVPATEMFEKYNWPDRLAKEKKA